MRFLADESCDFRVVRALRDAGHDVAAVIDVASGAEDPSVIDIAAREQRIFVTEGGAAVDHHAQARGEDRAVP